MTLRALLVSPVLALSCAGLAAHADTFAWTNWNTAAPGHATPGSASGTLASTLYGSIAVTYSGQTSGVITPIWGPASTFSGGVVSNSPAGQNGLQLEGGEAYTETLTFSHPVTDPAFAILSLGNPSVPAYFNFNASEPFNLVGGGPSTQYGGQAIQPSGTAIYGQEGSGVVQFVGTYNSLTFTTPDYENFYVLTIGEDATLTDNPNPPAPPTSVTPEPASLSLLMTGLATIPYLRRSLRR